MLRSIALCALLFAAPLLAARERAPQSFAPTPGTGTYTSTLGVEYARIGSTSLKADLHIPNGPGPYPVILWLHTGAWITGDRTGGPALR